MIYLQDVKYLEYRKAADGWMRGHRVARMPQER